MGYLWFGFGLVFDFESAASFCVVFVKTIFLDPTIPTYYSCTEVVIVGYDSQPNGIVCVLYFCVLDVCLVCLVCYQGNIREGLS